MYWGQDVQARHPPQPGQIAYSSARWLKTRSRGTYCMVLALFSHASLKSIKHFCPPSPHQEDPARLLIMTLIFAQLISLNTPEVDLSSSPSCGTSFLCGFGFNFSVLQFLSLFGGNRTDNVYLECRCCGDILGQMMHLDTWKKPIQRSQNLKSDAFFHFSFVKAL